jgi:hypothetical protein
MAFLDSFLALFKNTILYTVKGAILVALSYTFRFVTGMFYNQFTTMLIQVAIMAVGLFILESLIYLILPKKITGEETDCSKCQVPKKCECNCNCAFPSPEENIEEFRTFRL